MDKNHILQEYSRIIKEELKIKSIDTTYDNFWMLQHIISDANAIYGYTMQIAEVAKSSLLSRSYNKIYNLSDNAIAYESVGGHTNLVSALMDRALISTYGPDFGGANAGYPCTIDGFSYRDIMEAVRLHDLPENQIGDWPDNGSLDRNKKAALEQDFLQSFKTLYPDYENRFPSNDKALKLVANMDTRKYRTSDLLKAADKAAALIITLCYDSIGQPPMLHIDNPNLSKRDVEEMKICGSGEDGWYRASEMWAIDYFKLRKFNELDKDNFFTAIIVMYTLIVKGYWYTWREKDYFS
ncbi:hypothetical protein IKF12_01020 [Candidatus Saccharibacteria bacterium]|nr:hypothetical protein [Candidatus Saccharibacteria bacterium]